MVRGVREAEREEQKERGGETEGERERETESYISHLCSLAVVYSSRCRRNILRQLKTSQDEVQECLSPLNNEPIFPSYTRTPCSCGIAASGTNMMMTVGYSDTVSRQETAPGACNYAN